MRKMTPMILVILMLASVLSSIDVYELQEQNEFEETSARSGADPEVVYVTSPRETLYVDGSATNQMLAGEPVNFKAYLRNSGDADLTNMQYTVTVYNSLNGQRGDVATDSSGATLAWANDKAVCSNSCQASTVAPGDYIDGGESTLKTTSGAVIEWTPQAGDYFVEVKVTSQVLGDPGNDEISFAVSVKDYHDIIVDVAWLDSNGAEINGAVEGTDPVDFKVTVDLASSIPNMNIRTTNMSIQISNADVGGSNALLETIGVAKTVTTSDDGNGNAATDTRLIVGHDEDINTLDPFTGEKTFTLQPPSDGDYSVSVIIESYYVFDNNDGCSTADSFCERVIAGTDAEDEFRGNNAASIFGSATTIHDIMLSDYFLAPVIDAQQGEGNEDMEGPTDRYGFVGGDIGTPISTGDYNLVAEVTHSSSSETPIYEWNVTFTITDETGTVTEIEATECTDVMQYSHTYLGMATDRTSAEFTGYACALASMDQGEYTVEASANLIGEYDEDSMTVDDKGNVVDMITVNNAYSFDVSVVNFEPQILTLVSLEKSVLVGDSMTVVSTAFDVEGDKLTFGWVDGSGTEIACNDAGLALSGECTFTVTLPMVPSYEVRVTVSDPYNTVDQSLLLDVSVQESFVATGLTEGFAAVYSINARTSGLTVDFADGSLDPVTNPACANVPTPVGAVTVNPSTTYDSSVLIAHSMTVHFPTDLDVMQMWMATGNQVFTVASGDVDEVDATTSGYTYTFPAGSDMFSAGTTFYLISEDCETPDPPAGTITQLTATPAMGGDIVIAYNYDSLLSDENVRITVCVDASGCATPEVVYDRVESDTRSLTFSSGTHATVYDVTAALCNEYSCGPSVSVSATSDSEVASVTANDVTISESGENWVVAWTASSDDSDVAGWYVCYNRGEFTATEMKVMIDAGACKMVMDGTEATIAKYTTVETTQVHFGIVPHDAVMNIAYGASTDSILYDRAQDTTNPDDGTTTTDSEASSGVPTWTWGVIGAVVVVAFIVGAFILSRGEGEGDDDKEWDY